MLALATNDDGIGSSGLRALVDALAGSGFRVAVAAPRGDASGLGKAIRFPLPVRRVEYPGVELAWELDGPPASIVYAAVNHLLGERPALVASGVNHGPNLGASDMLTSATIGAALEAAFQGVVGLAFSHWMRAPGPFPDGDLVARVVAAASRAVAGWEGGVALSINIPEGPLGAVAARPAFNRYAVRLRRVGDTIVPVMEESRIYSNRDPGEGTDLWAYRRRLISVVPLGTDPPVCADERGWRLAWRVAERIEGALRG